VAVVLLPGLLATEAGGQKQFELDVQTVGEALRALPVSDLVLDEAGEVRPLVHVYVDGERAHDLDAPVAATSQIRIVAAIAGGTSSSRAPSGCS
jgi:molybdopterin converting factor small subunit